MQSTLTPSEIGIGLNALRDHLPPADLRNLLQLVELVPPDGRGVAVERALATIFPGREHKSATDAFGKLRQRLATAAHEAGVSIDLDVRGPKKAGAAQRNFQFVGVVDPPEPTLSALRRTEGREIPIRAVPQSEAIALLVSVNEHETQAVLSTFLREGEVPRHVGHGEVTYQDLGVHGEFKVLHAISEMGSLGLGAALLRCRHAIQDLRPVVVIGVGIAFGTNPNEQRYGDVLVSQAIWPYEPQRVNASGPPSPRAGHVSASDTWLQRLRQMHSLRRRGSTRWPPVHFGVLASGEKLIDNREFLQALVEQGHSKIIGGEMEGAGIAVAAQDGKVDWIVVKSISDWADGNKSSHTADGKQHAETRQRTAAIHAAQLVRQALTMELPPLPDELEEESVDLPADTCPEPKYAIHEHAAHRFVGPRAARAHLGKGVVDPLVRQRSTTHDAAASVDVLEYLHQWLAREDAPPLFALLGDYGTGKTVTCQRLAKMLNDTRRADPARRQALYFDLRDLTNLHSKVPTLDELLAECIARRWKVEQGQAALTPMRVHELHRRGALVIFDGLDEVLVHYDAASGQAFTRELLSLQRADSLGRLLVSCRSQFFRSLRDQATHFTGEDRDDRTARAYDALTLLPFTEDQIRKYLALSVPGADCDQVLATIRSVHNLSELAERPYTLSLIVEALPELERLRSAGRPVYGVTLYRHMVRSWLERDSGKHHIKSEHKMQLAAHLAASLWRQGQQLMEVEALETWFVRWLRSDEDLRFRYDRVSIEKLEEDLRNSTFLVRHDGSDAHGSGFRFAHTSLQEFFLAQYLFDALRAGQPQHWQLRLPSDETLDFFGQLVAEDGSQALLDTMSDWRKVYRHQASELLLRYALRAAARGWPVPVLAGIDLRGAHLQGWIFDGSATPLDLSGSRFDNATLREATFESVMLDEAVFTRSDLRGAAFLQARMPHAFFNGAQCDGTVFRRCDLDGTDFDGASTHGMQWVLCDNVPEITPELALVAPAPAQDKGPCTLERLDGHHSGICSIAVSPSGALLASGGWDGALCIWNRHSGEVIRVLYGDQPGFTCCAISPDGALLASGGLDGMLCLWDLLSGRRIQEWKAHESGGIACCDFSPDGKLLVTGGRDGALHLWNPQSGAALRTFQGHSRGVARCAISADGEQLVAVCGDKQARLLNIHSGEVVHAFAGHKGMILCCAVSPDGTLVVTGGRDSALRLWDRRSGQMLRSLSGHRAAVECCAISRDGKLLVSGSRDGSVRVWKLPSGEHLTVLSDLGPPVKSCAMSPDGEVVVLGYDDAAGTLRLCDLVSGAALRTLGRHTNSLTTCVVSPGSGLLVSGDSSGALRLWDWASGRSRGSLSGHVGGILGCAISSDGRLLASCGDDGLLNLWDPLSGKLLHSISAHAGGTLCCAMSPDGRHIMTGGRDGAVLLWEASSGTVLRALVEADSDWSDEVLCCALSPDGKLAAWGTESGVVRVFDLQVGMSIHTARDAVPLNDDEFMPLSCTFSPDSSMLAVGAWRGFMRLEILCKGGESHQWAAHKDDVDCCTFSPDGSLLATGGDDGTLRLWDANTRQELPARFNHPGGVKCCAFSPDGSNVVTGDWDGTLRLSNVRSGAVAWVMSASRAGHCVWSPSTSTVIEATGDAWRWMGWLAKNQDGPLTRLPLEQFGPLPAPRAQVGSDRDRGGVSYG
jgi:WD40 repeat protein/nucleoside phosphorylase